MVRVDEGNTAKTAIVKEEEEGLLTVTLGRAGLVEPQVAQEREGR